MNNQKSGIARQEITGVRYQVMWNRLISVVEEQALTLIRTAFSTSVREAGDLSAGIFDTDGRMIAQAVTGTPGHVNTMADALTYFIEDIGENNIYEGDTYLTNDPWKGTGHLLDCTLVMPSFRKGHLIGYFACTAHFVDMGGRGFGPDANDIYEEGLFIPIMKIFERGKVDGTLINLIRNNVREPDEVISDLYTLASCNKTGHNRLMHMMDEFSINSLDALRDFIFDNSYRATLNKISELKRGTYANSMTVDGYGNPVKINVTLTISENDIIADFSGTSEESPLGINVPINYTKAYCSYGLKCGIAPNVPNNYASIKPFKVSVPEGSILNAKHPAPVTIRHVLGHFVPDVVFGALSPLLPHRIPSEGSGALWEIQLSVRPIRRVEQASKKQPKNTELLMFNSGGTGARPTLDGMNATGFPSGVQAISVEAIEQIGAITIWHKELLQDTGGAGCTRGGLGQKIEIGANEGYELYIKAMFDRVQYPARGRSGGKPGARGIVRLDNGTLLNPKGRQKIPIGRRLVLEMPGGGGFGLPEERNATDVKKDISYEYISESEAKKNYHIKCESE